MIRITTDIPKALLSLVLSQTIDQKIGNEKIEHLGFDVQVKRQSEAIVTARKQSIYIDLPLEINISKSAGLFSIEATGVILLNLTISTDISKDLNLSTKTDITAWKWMEEPRVKLGALAIPASGISNLVLRKMEDQITSQLDEAIKDKVDLQKILNQKLASLIDSRQISKDPELYLRAQLEGVTSPGFREYTDKIEFPLYLEISNQITQTYQASTDWDIPEFSWIENDPLEYVQPVNIKLDYDKLEELILSKVDGLEIGGKKLSANKVKINNGEQLNIQVQITAPVEALLTISGTPKIATGCLSLDNMAVDLNASNILYKMTSPIIEKLIHSDLIDRLPINIESLIRDKTREGIATTSKLPMIDIRLDTNQVDLTNFTFLDDHIQAQVTVKELELALLMEHMGAILAFAV